MQKYSTEEVIQFLINDKLLIPKKEFITSQAKENKKQGLFYMLTGNINIFDQRGNLVKIYSTDEEKEWREIMQMYRFSMQFKSIKINMILESLITKRKISLETIHKYMKENTWISHTFAFSLANSQSITYTFYNIIYILLKEYFHLFEKQLKHNNLTSLDVFMFIDSLTLKFEGLIRELFSINNYPTFILNNDTGTAFEKDLNALLHDENIKNFLDEDELLFYKYLFIEQEGINLRNRIAHSLFFEQEYDMGLANLLFIALLRLFKFIIENK